MAPPATLPAPPPRTLYLKCVNDKNQPADYVGDWPVAGQVYAAQVLPHARTGAQQVHLHGFHAEKPYGAFAVYRFELVADVWLN